MPLLQDIKCYILDMDGTLYLGNRLLPGAGEFIDYLKNNGMDYLFLTNNSSQDSSYYLTKLRTMGIFCDERNILTSGEATAHYIKNIKPDARIYLLGTHALENEFIKWGFTLTADNPDFVVLGFDKTITYDKILTACNLIRSKVTFIATHPDVNCPTEQGAIPDCGAIIEMIKASTGISPKIIGKPYREIIDMVLSKKGYSLQNIAIVGDRLYTDIATGINAGICTILVLSGETNHELLQKSEIKPDYIFSGLDELVAALMKNDKKSVSP